MSLVFCKNKDNSQISAQPSSLLPYRWSNYYTQPIKIPPNSQVAYVSSTFNMNTTGRIQDETYMYFLIGQPELNAHIPIKPPDDNVDDWAQELNFLGSLCNNYTCDATYTDVNNKSAIYEGVIQNQFIQGGTSGETSCGWNFLYRNDDKVDVRVNPRYVNNVFNQGFNCMGRNIAYTTDFPYTTPAGINQGTGADFSYYYSQAFYPIPSPRTSEIYWDLTEDKAKEIVPNVDTFEYDTTANFYNTQWTNDELISPYQWNTSGSTITPPNYTNNEFAGLISNTGLKQYVGGDTPSTSQNGGGHQHIGGADRKSGGYCVYTTSNTDFSEANTFCDTAFAGGGNEGFCGWKDQFFGLQSIPYIQSYGTTYSAAMTEFLSKVDVNKSNHTTLARGGASRYCIGVNVYSTTDTILAQTQVLDTSASLEQSQYINVGPALDLKKLYNGITTAVTPEFEFDASNKYRLNVVDGPLPAIPTMLMFRFRWSSPYTIAVEYTLSSQGDADSYNLTTDEPYLPSIPPTQDAPVVDPTSETVALNNSTDGTERVLTNDTTFTDIGGGGNYTPNNDYTITFDAKSGYTVKMTINSFGFEHSSFAMYDRLGIEVSNDGVNFSNFSGIPWMNKSSTSTPPYSTSFAGGSQASSGSYGTDGYIFPDNEGQAQTYDPSAVFPYEFETSFRFIRFHFISDGSSNDEGWNITLQPNTPYTTGGFNNADPRNEWCLLYDMKADFTTQQAYYIPQYFGDMGLVSYHRYNESGPHTKGYFDLRRGYRYTERLAGNETSSNLYTGLNEYTQFFNRGGLRAETLLTKNDAGFTTPKLVGITPELFGEADSRPLKELQVLANTFKVSIETNEIQKVNGKNMFQVNQPVPLLEMGWILGLIKTNDNNAVVLLNKNLDGVSGQDYFDYGFNGLHEIQLSDKAFSNHIQIANLPIQSQNGVRSTQNKAIYIINSLCINSVQKENTYRIFCDTAPQLLWIDLNNYSEMNINKLDIVITDDENNEQKMLTGNTDLVLMFRAKPKSAEGYIPSSIPVNEYIGEREIRPL